MNQDPDEIVQALVEIRNDPPSVSHIREVAERYDFSALTETLLTILEEV